MSYHITSEVLIQYYSGLVTMLNDVRVIRSCRNLLHRQNNFGIAVLPDPFSKGLAGCETRVHRLFQGIFATTCH